MKDGDEEAKNLFLEKYNKFSWSLVISYVAKYRIYEPVKEDLQSIVFADTLSVLKKYTPNKGRFYPFWKRVSLRRIQKYIRETRILEKLKLSPLSFDTFMTDNNKSLHDVVGFEDKSVQDNKLAESILKTALNPTTGLSEKEQIIIEAFLSGFDFKEIALSLDLSLSGVYKCYKTAVKKIGIVLKGPRR